jgi:hypothetical protein
MTDQPAATMDEIVLNLIRATGATDPNSDPAKTAAHFASVASEWSIPFRSLLLSVSVGATAVIAANMERGQSYPDAYRVGAAWSRMVVRNLIEEGERHIEMAVLKQVKPQ